MNQSTLTVQPGNQLSMKTGYLAAWSLLAAATLTCLVHTRRPRCWQLLCCDAHYQYQGHQATGHWGIGPSREWRPACILFNRSPKVTYVTTTISWLIFGWLFGFWLPISTVYLLIPVSAAWITSHADNNNMVFAVDTSSICDDRIVYQTCTLTSNSTQHKGHEQDNKSSHIKYDWLDFSNLTKILSCRSLCVTYLFISAQWGTLVQRPIRYF